MKLKKLNYAISGLASKQEVNSDFVPLPNVDPQNALSDLIRTYSKEKENLKLDLRIYNEESFDVTIPFKKRTDVSINGFQYYDTTTKKQETIEFYDYYAHREKFYFTWKNDQLEFEYSVKLSADKKRLIKKISLGKSTRRKLCVDESSMWGINLRSNETKSILFEYI